jgi:hypothetical protein
MIVTRFSNRSARACSTPFFSAPASGWAGTKLTPAGRFPRTAATIPPLVLPPSVKIVPSRQCGAARRIISAMRSTGVQTTTRSASFTPPARSVLNESMAPSSTARARVRGSRPTPTTRRATPRAFAASPTEPPIKPTPTMVIWSNDMRGL